MPAPNTYQLIVNYNANGGSGAPSSQTKLASADYSPYTITITLSTKKPTRSGYTFLGWSTSSSASSASYSAGGSYSYTFDAISGTQTTTLYAVWSAQKSTIALTNGTTAATIGDATSITINRSNSSYTHTITYSFGSASGTITTKTSSTAISWTPAASLASQIPNTNTGTCTLTCTTYNGNTSLGSTTLTITLYVKQSVKQKIGTVTTTEGTSMPSGISVFVQNKSKIHFSIATNGADAYGATVVSCATYMNGKYYNGTSFTTDTISSSGTIAYTITLTDSRGRTDTKDGSVYVYAYSSPTITAKAVRNSTNNTHADVTYTYSFASVNGQNTKTIKIYSKLTSASSYPSSPNATLTPSSTSGTSTYTITNTLDAAYPYNIKVTATDKFSTVSYILTLSASGARYIECDKSTGTVIHPLKTRLIGETTMNENATVSKSSGAAGLFAERSDVGVRVGLEVGTGGTNHGLYSHKDGRWMIYDDVDGRTVVPTKLYMNDANFTNAPTVAGHSSHVGDIKTVNASSTTIATATNKVVASIVLTAGTWIITARARFSANATGYRHINISTTSADNGVHIQVPAVSGAVTQLALTRIVAISAQTTFYLNAYQNSGSTLTMAAGSGGEINALTAIRIL